MGRSPHFTLSQVELPHPTSASDALKELTVGKRVGFTFGHCVDDSGLPVVCRSISTYAYIPSAISNNITYEVTSIDAIPAFAQLGLRVISLIDVHHSNPSMHMDGWYITTDGYVRECEHFGITATVTSVIAE